MISWFVSDIAGVNFGDSHITVARMSVAGGGGPVVTHVGWAPYDPAGTEKDIAKALKDLWRTARIPTTLVNSSLRSSAVVMRYFKMPSMSGEDFERALTLQAEEALQLTREQVSVDWHMQDQPEGSALSKRAVIEGIMVAAPVKDVDRQLSILTMAGLEPVIVDIRSVAVANLYVALITEEKDEAVCIVNLAPHSADVIVLSKTGGIYPYTVFCRASTWVESPEFLSENIRDVLRYAEFKLDWEPSKRVYLSGDVMVTGEFIEKIRAGLNIPVEMWNPLHDLSCKTRRVKELLDSDPESAAMLVPCLGLALRRG